MEEEEQAMAGVIDLATCLHYADTRSSKQGVVGLAGQQVKANKARGRGCMVGQPEPALDRSFVCCRANEQ